MTLDEMEIFFLNAGMNKNLVAEMKNAYNMGVRFEREACAKLCEDLDDDLPDGLAGWQFGEAIRARGEA